MARARRAATAKTRTRPSAAAKTSTARRRSASRAAGEFKCPECGRTFARAAALGAHRRRAHGVVGATASSRSTKTASARRRASSSRPAATTRTARRRAAPAGDGGGGKLDRNALLAALFPNGIPPREDVIRAANRWLDDAEQLAKMR
jgi:hypothetical protein